MNRRGLVTWSAWALLGTGVPVQSQTPRPAPPPGAQALTLNGCVRPWDPSTMGPPPAAAMGAPTPVLVLTGAEKAVPDVVTATPVPDAAKPPTGGAPVTGGHSTYLLKAASPSVNLAAHVDHRVELTGTLATDYAAATPAAPTTPPGSSATSAPSDGARAPTAPVSFTVTGIRMIDKACTAK